MVGAKECHPNFLIRRAVTFDTPAIAGMHRDSWLEVFGAIKSYPESSAVNLWSERLWNPSVLLLIAAIDGSTVGYISSSLEVPSAEITDLFVSRHQRQCGIARALLQHALEALPSSGVTSVSLSVSVVNSAAIQLYVGQGFRSSGKKHLMNREGAQLCMEQYCRSLAT